MIDVILKNTLKMGGVAALVASTLAISNAAEAITFSSTSSTYNIPDANNTGVSATINISGQGNITSFDSVTISGLNHTFYADLQAFLSNGTTTVQLFDCADAGGCSGPFTNYGIDLNGNYTFANTGANWYNQSTDPLPSAATYASLQSLDAFVGQSLNGTWTLNVKDQFSGSTGSFTQFSFNVNNPATAIPFEFETGGGLAILGGAWLLRRQLQKKNATKV